MWKAHQADPAKYPGLSEIVDDSGDDVPEINRPEEIDALIRSVADMLAATGYPMQGKRVVWVMDDRVYTSGTEFRTLDVHPWEASPFANVHKYNHDMLPANAALGVNGCTDCHHPDSAFFFARNVKYLFDENARPVTRPQYELLGLSQPEVKLGAWREAYLKPVTYAVMVVLALGFVGAAGGGALRWVFEPRPVPALVRPVPFGAAVVAGVAAVMLLGQPRLMQYMLPTRFWLDSHHFLLAVAILAAGVAALLLEMKAYVSGEAGRSWLASLTRGGLLISLALACAAGSLMVLKIPGLDAATRYSYTAFDLALALVLLGTTAVVLRHAA
jgi:hypothetical protein